MTYDPETGLIYCMMATNATIYSLYFGIYTVNPQTLSFNLVGETNRYLSVLECTADGRLYRFIQRNKLSVGEGAELISPGEVGRAFPVRELYGAEGERLESTPHPSMIYWCRVPFQVRAGDILRAAEGRGLEVRAKDRLKGDSNRT